ncbi:MAG: DUF523 domain-containing protein [Lutisporaceae bacterium]
MNILISACLLGVNTRYNGGNNKVEKLTDLVKDVTFIPVCPEQLGGLPTPRHPAEIIQGNEKLSIVNNQGESVTSQFVKGAEETLKIAQLYDCKYAILKERSPSCGSNKVYDGSFQGKVRDGKGVAATLLQDNGIKVFSEENINDFLTEIKK